MRPHGAGVIADRVVTGLASGIRADPPTGEETRRHQSLRYEARPLGADDPRPQALAGIRGNGVDGPFFAVQGHRVVGLVVDPEGAFEALAQGTRLRLEVIGQRNFATQPCQTRHPQLRLVDVALHLRQGNRRLCLLAVAVPDAVA